MTVDTPISTEPSPTLLPSTIREDLELRIVADLLGPAEGPDERLDLGSRRVRDRYIVGMLAPRNTVWATPNSTGDEDEVEEPEGSEVETPIVRPAAKPVLMPSSFGLSFAVEAGVDRVVVDVSWGRYVKEQHEEEEGSRRGVWQRIPVAGTLEVALPISGEIGRNPIPAQPQVGVSGRVRRTSSNAALVTLFLVNGQSTPARNKDSAWLFQAQMRVGAVDGAPVFIGRNEALGADVKNLNPAEAHEMAILDMQYRDVVEFAIGHGISTNTVVSSDPRRAISIETVAIPRAEVAATETPSPSDRPELAGVEFDMAVLANVEGKDLADKLRPLAQGYEDWLAGLRHGFTSLVERLDGHSDAAEEALSQAEALAEALRDGVELVCSDPTAAEAFRFANRAMWQQRVRTEAIELRRRDPDVSLEEALAWADADASRHTWRPFQLAFLCINAPSLTQVDHIERSVDDAVIDLLFFPTGGGKTEAYLGLVAYCFAIRRLHGEVSGHDGSDGVAVLMRYTLRALTVQQFERAASLVCACETVRREDPGKWGQVPFRLGMWVGSGVTPNKRSAVKEAVIAARMGKQVRDSNPLQLTSCPWCGSELDLGKDVDGDNVWDRTLVYCSDPLGVCVFTKKRAEHEGIPVLTVDEEIYRLLPSFIIATVDKFAQLPWKGPLRMLFGRVERRCERHGYRSEALDKELSELKEPVHHHPANGPAPAVSANVPCPPLRPPDLIIQDELHLITGPLGTMAGLYETAVDRLASWDVDGRRVRPKVVASTATIRRAAQQAYGVFARSLRLFPPPVLDVGDSFFARQVNVAPKTPGRAYLGICAHGRRLKEVENRVFATVMGAAQAIYEHYGAAADPWMTTVGYFNAIRELAGMKRLADDELKRRLERAGSYPGLASRYIWQNTIEEMTSRRTSAELRPLLDRLKTTFDPNSGDDERSPIDLMLATNMISVGVDVPRLGLMVAVGQPKSSAEYIQATSRVGRSPAGPGLVVTIYNWSRPRDLSHYEAFEHFHATYYRQVEPLSVTPFAPRALDRGLTAVLIGLLRHLRADWNPPSGAQRVDRHDSMINEVIDEVARRGAAVDGHAATEQLIRNELDARLDALAREQNLKKPHLAYEKSTATSIALLNKPEAGPWNTWTCPNSLRNTEPMANLLVDRIDLSVEHAPPFRPAPPRQPTQPTAIVPAAEDELDPSADEVTG